MTSAGGWSSETSNPEFRFIDGKNTPSIRVVKGSNVCSVVGERTRGGVSYINNLKHNYNNCIII